MTIRAIALVAGLATGVAAPDMGFAQDWRGAELVLGYSAFFDETDVDKLSLKGSGETMLGNSFSLQGDFILSRFGAELGNANNVTLHGIYNFTSPNALGVFVGRDEADGDSGILYGIEGNHGDRALQFQWYVGQVDTDDADATLYGADLWFEVAPNWLAGLHYDRAALDDGDIDLDSLSVSMRFDLTESASLFAQYGETEAGFGSLSGSETYFAFGARFNFGARGGTTMGYRSLDNVLLAN
jgi:hypothetical protein